IEYRAYRDDRGIQPIGDLAIGALELARLHECAVELVGKTRAICAERLDPRRELVLVAIGIAPPLDRAFERVERRHEPAGRDLDLDGRGLGHGRAVGYAIVHAVSGGTCGLSPGGLPSGKRLGSASG